MLNLCIRSGASDLNKRYILGIGFVFIVLGVVLLNLGLYPLYGLLPNQTYWDSTITVRAYNIRTVEMGFIPKGAIILGKITIYSEPPIINASLMDSSGRPIIHQVRIEESYKFAFQSTKDDFYYFNFDNSQSPQDKIILWQIYYYADFPRIFLIAGTIFLIAAAILFLVFFLRLKKN